METLDDAPKCTSPPQSQKCPSPPAKAPGNNEGSCPPSPPLEPIRPHTSSRRPPTGGSANKRRKIVSSQQRKLIDQRLSHLQHNLVPKPFLPSPDDLDSSALEPLLRPLGLWSFFTSPLPSDIHTDILNDLIAYYIPAKGCTYVKGSRITLSRAALAHAFSLPVKRSGSTDPKDSDKELLASGSGPLTQFIHRWIVIADEGIVPSVVTAAIEHVQAGHAWKIDWAGLLWALVETDIVDAPSSNVCYYASHLQHLVKHQKSRLFDELEEEVDDEVGEEEEEPDQEPPVEAPDEEMPDAAPAAERQQPCREEDGGGASVDADVRMSWNNGEGEHGLSGCTANHPPTMSYEEEARKGEQVEAAGDDDGGLISKFASLDGQDDVVRDVDPSDDPFCPSLQMSMSTGEFLEEQQVDYRRTRSPFYGNNGKRTSSEVENDELEEDEEGDDIHPFPSGSIAHKRLRSEPTPNTLVSFHSSMDQAYTWLQRSKMEYSHKEQELLDAQMQLHCLNELIHQKDQIIENQERVRIEEQQKRQLEIRHFQQEHSLMANMVLGYQKALGETRKTFDEYRKKFPQGEESVYKDAGGPGGDVLTVRELERQCREVLEKEIQRLQMRELENRLVIANVLNFANEWTSKFERHQENVAALASRVHGLFEGRKYLEDRVRRARSGGFDAKNPPLEGRVDDEDKKSAVLDDAIVGGEASIPEDGSVEARKDSVLEEDGLDEKGSVLEEGRVDEKSSVLGEGGADEKGSVLEEGGVGEKGSVLEEGGVGEKGSVLEEGGVGEKGSVLDEVGVDETKNSVGIPD